MGDRGRGSDSKEATPLKNGEKSRFVKMKMCTVHRKRMANEDKLKGMDSENNKEVEVERQLR